MKKTAERRRRKPVSEFVDLPSALNCIRDELAQTRILLDDVERALTEDPALRKIDPAFMKHLQQFDMAVQRIGAVQSALTMTSAVCESNWMIDIQAVARFIELADFADRLTGVAPDTSSSAGDADLFF